MAAETGPTTSHPPEPGVNYLELTFGLMGGALIWLLRLIANSALVEVACSSGATWSLWLSTAVSTLIAVAALYVSVRYWRDRARGETVRWLGLLGAMFNVLAIAGILLESAPIAFLDVCRGIDAP